MKARACSSSWTCWDGDVPATIEQKVHPATTGEGSAHMERFTAVSPPRTVATRRRSMILRRCVTLPAAMIGFPILVLVSPALAVVTIIVDLVAAPRRFPTTRLLLAAVGYAAITVATQVCVAAVWAWSLFGLRNWHHANQDRLARMTRLWVAVVSRWFGSTLGYRLEVEGDDLLVGGPLLVFARHQSIFDSFLAPLLVTRDGGLVIRVVLMRELRLEPNLDMVAHRAPHHFVERSGVNPEAEIEAIARLATDLPTDCAVIIFPEGRLFRPEVRARILARLEASDPEAAARARELDHLLPPRVGGPQALLEAAPDGTDVVFVGHVGYEGLTDPRTLWRSIPLALPIEVRAVRHGSEEVPVTHLDRIQWVHDRWREMDSWVGERQARRRGLSCGGG